MTTEQEQLIADWKAGRLPDACVFGESREQCEAVHAYLAKQSKECEPCRKHVW